MDEFEIENNELFIKISYEYATIMFRRDDGVIELEGSLPFNVFNRMIKRLKKLQNQSSVENIGGQLDE